MAFPFLKYIFPKQAHVVALGVKKTYKIQVQSLGHGDPLDEGMKTHSSILAWRNPWTKEPGRLWSIASQRVDHDWSDLAH